MMMSAPKFFGVTESGVNVLSTISFKLCFFAIDDIFFRSATSNNGLEATSQ